MAISTDGRDIDTNLAELSGEGAAQKIERPDRHLQKIAPAPWERVPQVTPAETTYYERPLLKQSVWSADIPLYYFVGGAAGAALTLGAAMQLAARGRRRRELRALSAHCHWIGIIGSTAGAAFLIHDLGRPSRFLNMMRVFRPTSPMNMGAWILAGAAPTAIATGLLVNRRGLPGKLGEATGYASGVFGAALAGYTGVLVSNSVIPVWQPSRRWMPVLFIASAASSAASILDLFYENRTARRVTGVFGTASRLMEIAASRRVEHLASTVPQVGAPFRSGAPGVLWKAAGVLTATSVALSLLKRHRLAGVLGAAGSLALRFAVHSLGNASARDPRASFAQQRA
ncbi:MAG TPA: NrfD/PsrC family molybdoenzyme membrane anchor subunit [Bryobacteraceae bacterium]|nr:NrfD/PsrC family molybdoenzyme membrane anchor subunit [Bryobacteraceae bacterium]